MTDSSSSHVKVSIALWTYNHEHFIAQAIESVLMQQTDFEYELIIGEDCSTDGTRALVVEYGKRYPEQIRLILQAQNVGGHANSIAVLNACRGRYTALLDGDDYWTDPHKLQKQVDLLEAHPDYALCFHNIYKLVQTSGLIVEEKQKRKRPYYNLADITSMKIGIPTVSVVFRNGLVPEFPSWFYDSPVGDTPLFFLLAQHGKIGLIDETMAVYRVHQGGGWQGSDERKRTEMNYKTLVLLQKHLGPGYQKLFHIPIANNFLNEARLRADEGDITNARIYIKKSVRTSFSFKGKWIDQLALLCRLYCPRIYKFCKWIVGRG